MAEEVCNLVVFGQKSPDIALVVNGLTGILLVTPEETNQQNYFIKEEIAKQPGVTDGPNQPIVSVKAFIFASLGADANQTPELMRLSCPKEKVGVLVYCVTVNRVGIETGEMIEEINKVTRAYGADVWKNCVVVFLKAHQCIRDLQIPSQQAQPVSKESFNIAIDLRKEQVRSTMLFSKSMITTIPQGIVRKLGFAVAGKESELSLPGRDFWLSFLWVEVFEKSTKDCYQKGVSRLANFQARMKEKADMRKPEVTDKIIGKKIWEQPISTGNMSLRQKIAIGAGGTAAGVAAGGIGATIGALIGALAIGIPSFGVAAGAGLVIGATVGGSIGVGVAGATTAGVNAYQKAKEEEEQENCKLNNTAFLMLITDNI